MIDNKSYICINGWMINELKLKGNELFIYAIIFAFTNGTNNHYFNGSLNYLSEWTNQSVRNVQNNLKSLLGKGLLIKDENYENGIKIVRYQTTYGKNFYGMEKISENMEKISRGVWKKFPEGMEKISTNIKEDIKEIKEETSKLDETIQEFIKFRKSIKKPINDYGLKLLRNKLNKFYPDDEELQIACINNAIEHGWQSVYELKEDELKLYKKPPKKKKEIELIFT